MGFRLLNSKERNPSPYRKRHRMSASSSVMGNLQTTLEDFLGGGISVKNKNGSGFQSVLDPATGSYATTIKTGGAVVSAGGVGQAPGGIYTQLTATTSGKFLLFGGIAIIGLIGFSFLRR